MMTTTEESVLLNRLPGETLNDHLFDVHPEENIAFSYDLKQDCFVRINLDNGQTQQFVTEDAKTIVGHQVWWNIRAIVRSSKTFIVALIIERGTGKYFLVSFLLNGEKFVVNDEHFVGITRSCVYHRPTYMFTDEKEQIYFISYCYQSERMTLFDSVKIDVDNEGNITSVLEIVNYKLDGLWHSPFIRNGVIHWMDGILLNNERVLTFELVSKNVAEIKVTNEVDKWATKEGADWTEPTVIGNEVFFIVGYGKQLGFLVHFDLNLKYWKQNCFIMKEDQHVMAVTSLIQGCYKQHSKYGPLYVAGKCGLESCKGKYHIYVIDLKETRTADKNVVDNIEINLSSLTLEHNHRESKKWTPTNYVKEEELGRGGFGVVYKCFDKSAHKFFVAKETFSQDQEFLDIAQNEINRLKDIDHPRIVDYYGFKIEGNGIVIFMEFMAAGSLKQMIDIYGLIEEPVSIRYIDQILDSLAFIHNIGIVHCDVKCDNILSDGQGSVKLGDFGIAVQKTLNTANHSYFTHDARGGGTFYWLAPEVMNNEGCSRRSDIWSLGCTVVEMLTGSPPYSTMPILQFMTALGNKSLSYHPNELIPSSSDRMKKFLSYLLLLESGQRPYSAEDTIVIYKKIF